MFYCKFCEVYQSRSFTEYFWVILIGHFRSNHRRCYIKKAVLKNSAVFTEKHLQVFSPATFLKETPAQVFSYEYCEMFKKTYFEEYLQTVASSIYLFKGYLRQKIIFGHIIAQWGIDAAQKMKFSIMNFLSKCDQIRRKLRIWSNLLKKSSMENFIFYAVWYTIDITAH